MKSNFSWTHSTNKTIRTPRVRLLSQGTTQPLINEALMKAVKAWQGAKLLSFLELAETNAAPDIQEKIRETVSQSQHTRNPRNETPIQPATALTRTLQLVAQRPSLVPAAYAQLGRAPAAACAVSRQWSRLLAQAGGLNMILAKHSLKSWLAWLAWLVAQRG